MARDLLALNGRADELLEECARRRLGLKATLERFLPGVCAALGASAALIRTKNEDLEEETFSWGLGPLPKPLAKRLVKTIGGRRWVFQDLDVAGLPVGSAAFAFPSSDKTPAEDLQKAVDTVCEQLDGVLWSIDSQAFKQQLIEHMGRSLTRHVFDDAIDDAVADFRKAVRFRRFALVYLDDEEGSGRVHYRVYEAGRCSHHSKGRPHAGLDKLLRARGESVLEPGSEGLASALGSPGAVTYPLIAGVARPRAIGEALVDAPQALDTFGRDLLHVFANAVSQRLVDYNRERRHLSQFFSPAQIDGLVREQDYAKRLAPRVARIGLLYADINSFTKICERALKKPDRIGAFVDAWSTEAVKIVWKHGGVFDKMVGDCVIALFGPPFYKRTESELAAAAVAAALEIQRFTVKLGSSADFRAIPAAAGLPGLGVAVGVNLSMAAVGLFGPNQDLTAFSRGMNETARLQSQAGFRETVVMDSVHRVLKGRVPGAKFSPLMKAKVKNVDRPLKYYKLSLA